MAIGWDVADLLEQIKAKDKRIAELEAALKPPSNDPNNPGRAKILRDLKDLYEGISSGLLIPKSVEYSVGPTELKFSLVYFLRLMQS